MRARVLLLALTTVGTASLAACDGVADQPGHDGTDSGAVRMDPAVGGVPAGLSVLDPWIRVAIRPEGSDAPGAPPVNSAAYLRLHNPGTRADALIAVETEIADTAEIHSVTMDGDVMRMRAVDSVSLPAGGEAVLEPGGHHVMLIGIRDPLAEGDSVSLLLRLRSGDSIFFEAPVLRSPPQG